MKHFFALLLTLPILAGCPTLPANPEKMSPEQLREWAKDKNANIACGVGHTPYGKVTALYVILDKGIVVNGTVTVDPECKVTIDTKPK